MSYTANENEKRTPNSVGDATPFQFSLRSLFRLTALVAVLTACIKCGGISGILFASSAAALVVSMLAAKEGRRRKSSWWSYLFVLLVLAALLMKAAEAGIHC